MKRERIREALRACKEEMASEVYHWELAAEVKPKRLAHAIEAYAPEVKPEEIVAILDTTIGKSGKDGFLLTEGRLYGKCLSASFLNLDALDGIAETPKNLLFLYRDGTVYEAGITEQYA